MITVARQVVLECWGDSTKLASLKTICERVGVLMDWDALKLAVAEAVRRDEATAASAAIGGGGVGGGGGNSGAGSSPAVASPAAPSSTTPPRGPVQTTLRLGLSRSPAAKRPAPDAELESEVNKEDQAQYVLTVPSSILSSSLG